ncbi:YHS domain-containing (seleno)protein [Larkinella rosea]|uniref:YHS domain-containing protein n=1 Tax=Larkinella rosea TaxID=2025312 RepID=A0A3P1BSA9_9BACT|nr:YHS domain-containing (seleno)protein [Larkinella rosea]RRB03982.1 YHS domain-containing protein [Larkinella rosea]
MQANFFRLTAILLFVVTTTFAQKPAIFSKDDKAIGGYDPVGYFTEGKPVMGSSDFTWSWQGANWQFASEKNRTAFKAEPERFAPQYGGYCAFGMSRGYKAPTEADAWTIVDNKLYFNYNQKVRTEWDKDRPGYIQKADKSWVEVKEKK